MSYEEYLQFSKQWMANCYQWSHSQARFCLNIPLDKNKGGNRAVGADLTRVAQEVGWKYKFTIIWNEGNISRRTAWGSWKSASAPIVIAPVELIVVLYKDNGKKQTGAKYLTFLPMNLKRGHKAFGLLMVKVKNELDTPRLSLKIYRIVA